ncbi:plasmid mobilization protein [Peribacillus sp. NPDC096622]|uniref:plasmid mobilization protein n=1 Tax=Peribacillus sp. NPDC096622 TaxID=3364396 RepID=UPI00382622CF
MARINTYFQMRLTEEDKKFIKNKADKMGYNNVSAFLLESAKSHFRLNIDMSIYRKLTSEINYIGKNINSLIRKVNTLGAYSDIDNFEKQLTAIDDEIFDFEKMKDCFSIYKNSYPLITDYKKSDDKTKFKQENYYLFKQYDMAKRNINFLKKHYGIDEESSFHYKLSLMKNERNLLYGSL